MPLPPTLELKGFDTTAAANPRGAGKAAVDVQAASAPVPASKVVSETVATFALFAPVFPPIA